MGMLSQTHQLLLETHLAQARRHVTLGEKRIVDQERLAARLAVDGHNTEEAEKLLVSFQQLQRLHLEHCYRLRAELANANRVEIWDQIDPLYPSGVRSRFDC